jgi:hypothetical protein
MEVFHCVSCHRSNNSALQPIKVFLVLVAPRVDFTSSLTQQISLIGQQGGEPLPVCHVGGLGHVVFSLPHVDLPCRCPEYRIYLSRSQ